jgi:hypothetical protein
MTVAHCRRKFLKQSLIAPAALLAGGVAARLGVAYAADDSAALPEEGFRPLFNGKDLSGWEGDTKLWLVEEGMLIGRSPGIKYNDFLATRQGYRDFVLRFQIRLIDGRGNSGMQFRSRRVPPPSHEVSGYQADVAAGFWGNLYDESRRRKTLAGPTAEQLKKILRPAGWNDYEIDARGDHIRLALNGATTADYHEPDSEIARDGIFATQIHSGGPMEVQFRNIRIREV